MKEDVDDIYVGLREQAEVLGQTALSTRIRGAATILVTEMPATDISDLGIRTAPDLRTAVETAVRDLAEEGIHQPTCYVMPDARYAVPFVVRA